MDPIAALILALIVGAISVAGCIAILCLITAHGPIGGGHDRTDAYVPIRADGTSTLDDDILL